MITENSGLRRPREQLLRFDTEIFEENLRTIVLGLAQEALSEQQAARIALALMIAAPGSLQQGREILRNLADQRTPPTTANGAASDRSRNPAHTHHTRAALVLAAAVVRSRRGRQPRPAAPDTPGQPVSCPASRRVRDDR
ncbi:hypothetical protein [Streptomyces uncialis]|uniref:hypothetical protein n=1 Tax=Streptomyces uncialis TaxID=1048205 RepID=UPI00386C0658|nr:hypothetical protein OG924_34635 [Streptomyces uncialis]